MKIGIIGSRGQLGSALARLFGSEQTIGLDLPDFDAADPGCYQKIASEGLECLINTSAFNEVDRAESDIAEAFRLNAFAPGALSAFCAERGIRFVTFSTDYVFGNRSASQSRVPWTENDEALPLSVYGVSKWAGERLVLNRDPKAYVIRTCGLYGAHRSSRRKMNFVDLMVSLGTKGGTIRVVHDQIVAPTSTASLAKAVFDFLAADPPGGIYHMASLGECSWYEFASAIFRIRGLSPTLVPVTQSEYGAKARRPDYSILSQEKIRKLGISLPHWETSLKEYLGERQGVPDGP
jgi:dTDP-4-dehydrorhamnose reductase